MTCEHTNDDGSMCPCLATVRLTFGDASDAIVYCDFHVGTLAGDLIRMEDDDYGDDGEPQP